MMTFRHQSVDPQGRTTDDLIAATDRRDALQRLRALGYTPVKVYPESEGDRAHARPLTSVKESAPSRLGRKPLFGTHPASLKLIGKLEQLTSGGLPAGDAVRLLSARTGEPELKAVATALWRDLSEGRTLAESLRRFPGVFDTGTCGLVEAGESTGTLGVALKRVMELQLTREQLRKKLTAALTYPALVCGLAGVTIALFVFHLLPRLEVMMRSLNAEFSGASYALIFVAKSTVYGLPIALGLAIALTLRVRRVRRSPEGRIKSDAMLLRIPLAGAIIRHADVAGLSGLLSTLLASGVNATDALRLTEKTVSNTRLKGNFSDARIRINEGASFSSALRKQGLLDEAELDILLVNESTGTLPRAFEEISKIRLGALDDALRHLVRSLSGIFLLAAFSIVFFCLVSVMLSVLQVSRSILG